MVYTARRIEIEEVTFMRLWYSIFYMFLVHSAQFEIDLFILYKVVLEFISHLCLKCTVYLLNSFVMWNGIFVREIVLDMFVVGHVWRTVTTEL